MDKPKAMVATLLSRDRVIEKLQDHYAQNHIEVQDFETRVELAERANTETELLRSLDGLPNPETALVPAGRLTTSIAAVFGSATRRGRWRLPSLVTVRALLGNVELDLCEAELTRGETVIDVSATFGSVTITVPEGLAVECEGSALFGSFDHIVMGPASKRDVRVVRIQGNARFGSVDIIVKKKGGFIAGIKALLSGGA